MTRSLPTDSISPPRSHAVLFVAITATPRRNWTPAPRRKEGREDGGMEGGKDEGAGGSADERGLQPRKRVAFFNTTKQRDGRDLMLQPRALFHRTREVG